MKHKNFVFSKLVYAALAQLICASEITLVSAEPMDGKTNANPQAYNADNSKVNQRDKSRASLTADDQVNSSVEDRNVLANIRKAVTEADNLSTYAQNAKIVVQNGTITLRGPVRSAEESAQLEQLSSTAAPGYKVVNELDVAPTKK